MGRPRYKNLKEKRKHLEANARARGSDEGSLFEYEADREAMNPSREAIAEAKRKRGPITSGRVSFTTTHDAAKELAKRKRKK